MSTLTLMIVIVFCIGYFCIAIESVTKVNKAAVALLMCVLCWTLLMMGPGAYYPEVAADSVIHHISEVIEHQDKPGAVNNRAESSNMDVAD